MADVIAEIEGVAKEGAAELAAVGSADALEQFRIKYLGSNGQLKSLIYPAIVD